MSTNAFAPPLPYRILAYDTDFLCIHPTTPDPGLNTCFGFGPDADATTALLRRYQQALNAFAGIVGFTPLVVDGRIDPVTTEATQRVVRFLLSKGVIPDPVVMGKLLLATPNVVAVYADLFRHTVLDDKAVRAAVGIRAPQSRVWYGVGVALTVGLLGGLVLWSHRR